MLSSSSLASRLCARQPHPTTPACHSSQPLVTSERNAALITDVVLLCPLLRSLPPPTVAAVVMWRFFAAPGANKTPVAKRLDLPTCPSASSSSNPPLFLSAIPVCSRCEQLRRHRVWVRVTVSALLGYLTYRWWWQHHSNDDYPFLARKTYPNPVRPPPVPLPECDPPPVFRVQSPSAHTALAAARHLSASCFHALASSSRSLLLPSSASCQTALEGVDPPHWHRWPHEGPASAFDTASLRRGFEVYRQVCSACHSLQWLHFRQLVNVTHTEEQAKALARSVRVVDGPDEEGRMYERPGTLADSFPPPYPNEEFARFVNNGASDHTHHRLDASVSH